MKKEENHLELNKIKDDAKLVGQCKISEPQIIYYSDSNQYEYGNLLFCDTFAILYDLSNEERKKPHFINSSPDCKYMTVKSGKWNLYEKKEIEKWGTDHQYTSTYNFLIMINSAIDINEFVFNESFENHACADGCSIQVWDISQVWLTSEVMEEMWKLHKIPGKCLEFYKTYPLINTGGDTGIRMKCYKYNNEICAMKIH